MRLRDQLLGVGERAEAGLDVAVVADVVAEVFHRRAEEGRHPHRIDAQARHVGQALDHAGEVADAVAVGIGKAARVDLVDDGATPPVAVVGGCGQQGLGLAFHGVCGAMSCDLERFRCKPSW
jgi:hypothetical protein